MENDNTLLWIGVLGIGGYLLYRHMNAQPAAMTTVVETSPGTIAPAVLAPGAGLPTAPINAIIQNPIAAAAAVTVPNGIDPNVYSVVMGWVQEDGRAPVLLFGAAAVPAEFAGMYDLITNYWNKNIKPGTAQVNFWNALRAKYDPGPPPDTVW